MANVAAVYDITIEKGSDFGLSFWYKTSDGAAIDLTGCSVEADIKTVADLTASPVVSFSATIPSPASQGRIDLALTKAQTSGLDGTGPNYRYKKQYTYDVILTLVSGEAKRILNGNANVSPGVTA